MVLSDMRILVSNDDGINAPGLKVLVRIAKSLSKDIWVVAPEQERSGAGHSLTLTDPLRVRRLSSRKFAVNGTPTDCVMLGCTEIINGRRPDLVLSGVNRGSNLGEDVMYSGTVAAAMEGTLIGIPSIALSQRVVPGDHNVKWSTTEHHAPSLITRLVEAGWPENVMININFPDVLHNQVAGVEVGNQGRRYIAELSFDARIDARGVPYYWLGYRPTTDAEPPKGSDIHAVENGRIAVTPLQLDMTHYATRDALRKVLS